MVSALILDGMKKRGFTFILFLLACTLFPAALTFAASPVVPNSEFGENGLALTDLGIGLDEAAAIAVQQDGRILVGGTSANGIDTDMAVVRYLVDGSEDPDFFFAAGSIIGAGFGDDGVRSLTIDTDGTILLGGYIEESGVKSGVVVRVLPSGQLDYNFGELGVVVLENDGLDSDFYDIALLGDGKIVTAGLSENATSTTPLLARFQADGVIDATFGTGGTQSDPDKNGVWHGIEVSPGGSILVGGYLLDDTQRKGLYLARYDSDGTVDPAFGEKGRVVASDPDEEIIAYDIGLLPDGGLVAVGQVIASGGAGSMMVARYLHDGSPDTEFSENGVLVYDIGSDSGAYSVTILEDGTILAAGYRSGPTGKDTVIVRFGGSSTAQESAAPEEPADPENDPTEIIKISALKIEPSSFALADASLYRSVQDADIITTTLSGSDEISRAITALPDGTFYTAGSSGSAGDTAIMVASYTDSVASGSAVNSAGPVVSDYYTIATEPITDVTRVGALTGGIITPVEEGDSVCVAECEALCDEIGGTEEEIATCKEGCQVTECEASCDETGGTEEEIATCKELCQGTCAVPTITMHGVVYSVEPDPEYKVDDGGGVDPPVDGDPVDPGGGTDPLPENPFGRDDFFGFDDYFVLDGQTEDGEGDGEYSSQIEDVNPQTVYYVRAYAVLSDGTVIYGNENVFKTNDSCFIATAAFGGIDDFAVQALRQFRDRFLKPYSWGQAFIGAYYHFSPPIADMVARSLLLRALVILLLLPVLGAALFMLYVPLLPFTLQSLVLALLARRYGPLIKKPITL